MNEGMTGRGEGVGVRTVNCADVGGGVVAGDAIDTFTRTMSGVGVQVGGREDTGVETTMVDGPGASEGSVDVVRGPWRRASS